MPKGGIRSTTAARPVRRITTQHVSHAIITAAMRVHAELGPGLLERTSGVGAGWAAGYHIDLLVEDLIIVELKSVDAIAPIHQAQILSYLKLSGKSLGLLINFNVVHLKDGIKRFVVGDGWKTGEVNH